MVSSKAPPKQSVQCSEVLSDQSQGVSGRVLTDYTDRPCCPLHVLKSEAMTDSYHL